jgi:aconitate hydratase
MLGNNYSMGRTVTQKLIVYHLAKGRMEPGAEIGLKIDQTLTQAAPSKR